MTILQTFNDMNNSNEDEQGFVWHLQRPNNAKLLINKLKDDKKADTKIQQLAQKLADTFGDEESESNDQDLLTEINQIIGEPAEK